MARYRGGPVTARSDPPSLDNRGAQRPRSGPADVPAGLLVAARNGDPAAFAQFVEHWDVHLRPFVHHTLAGDGSTDRVLAAAYLRAFRALPRYRAAQTPGLWLHRIAYLAAVDELRRLTRDPMRRRPRTHPAPSAEAPAADPAALGTVAQAIRNLAPDQRALATMVDLEGFLPTAVAGAFDTAGEVVEGRLASARRVLAHAVEAAAAGTDLDRAHQPPWPAADNRVDPAGVLGGVPVPGSADAPGVTTVGPATSRGQAQALSARPTNRVADESVTIFAEEPAPVTSASIAPDVVPPEPARADTPNDAAPDDAALPGIVKAALSELTVPPAGPTFWSDLGRRLIAERERPAAPPPDPVARLARAHPAEPGFAPGSRSTSVSTMADRAGRSRPRRRWGPILAATAAVLVVAALVAAAIAVGISGRTPDGSVSAGELAAKVTAALDGSRFMMVDATVTSPRGKGSTPTQLYRLMLGDDGSWGASRTDALDRVAFDSKAGLLRRVLVLPGAGGAAPAILASEENGLATGPPDPTALAPEPIADLQAIDTLLRAASGQRAPASRVGGVRTWTFQQQVGRAADDTAEEWRVSVRRSDGLPIQIERRLKGVLVHQTRFSGWEPATEVAADAFQPVLPPDTPAVVTEHGFAPADLPSVAILGRGEALTPSWLPEGFELAAVAIRGEAPAQAPSTGGGANPPDVEVMSLGYQRGPGRITVTTRSNTAPATDWTDPFASQGETTGTPRRRTLGDGRFNQAAVQITSDALGRAHLWGVADDTVFTVAGDLTAADAYRVAASLR